MEGELIVQIVQEDTVWWSGSSADGTWSGLFPAAYVALVEAPTEPEREQSPEAEAPPPPPPPPPPPLPVTPATVPSEPEPETAPQGVFAIALYEYVG